MDSGKSDFRFNSNTASLGLDQSQLNSFVQMGEIVLPNFSSYNELSKSNSPNQMRIVALKQWTSFEHSFAYLGIWICGVNISYSETHFNLVKESKGSSLSTISH